MNNIQVFSTRTGRLVVCAVRNFSSSTSRQQEKHYKLLVVGGGTGGCTAASKFASKLGKGKVAILEPSKVHYYQPMWTFVGGGTKTVSNSSRPMGKVLPKKADWIQAGAVAFDPKNSTVTCSNGDVIKYDYMVVSMGLQLDYHKVKGLPEALLSDPAVCSNYSSKYVTKTFPALENITDGKAIFTSPNCPIKCAGAAQKIMYIAEEYFNKNGKRDNIDVIFNTSGQAIFGVPKYAETLNKIIEDRNIQLNCRLSLEEVRSDTREAIFRKLDSETNEKETFNYNFLHVVPPMSAPDVLKASPLADSMGYLDINKYSLQHARYPNVFGIGDCTNAPTSKTGAAIAAQSGVLRRNLTAFMDGKSASQDEYDGYTSCPLVTGYGKCVMAEFDYDGNPLETFPIDQSKERRTMFHMKRDIMPEMYWNLLIKGMWEGPGPYRRLMRLGMGGNKKSEVAEV
ncbi:hypothetical protein ScPMuIL_002687 [Solemya velum]